ncbi:hypothetical protein QR46_2505 [Giardia duodenalis assemblage B]|uniref:Ribosomal RNA-processing protein 7 C-terminal domain-containing protein n=3 Tax=Giardia intestinalis TaxID=5741 RepID=A0A132NTS9_GIAIN|nr:Hypothetical protein GL50581_2470 [Giardia intestinalis ATCC 50581]ESU42923.1 Hypothetical protein GSB_17154 [Giardia intestinalis]KWX13489.1 hypothetical protein QR46_2505 [Giardia intestinalis assemblage B]
MEEVHSNAPEVATADFKILWLQILDYKPIPLYFSLLDDSEHVNFFVTGVPYILTQTHLSLIFSFFGSVNKVVLRDFALKTAQPHWSVCGPRLPRYAEIWFDSYPDELTNYKETTLYFNGKDVSDKRDSVPLEYNFLSLVGMYTQAYTRDTCMPADILAEVAEIFVRKYDTYLEETAPSRTQKDGDGWKTLTPDSKYYKNTYVLKNKILGIDEEYTAMKLKQMNQKMVEKGFYKFQQIEKKHSDLEKLRRRHAADKEIIERMRCAGRLNPFLHNMK